MMHWEQTLEKLRYRKILTVLYAARTQRLKSLLIIHKSTALYKFKNQNAKCKINDIKSVYKITNIRHSKIDYEMDPKEQLKCEKEIKDSGLKVIGIYHSHPSMQAYPSQTDVMRAYWPGDPDMPIYPDIGYMIIGPVDDDIKIRVFKINSGQKVDEINLNII